MTRHNLLTRRRLLRMAAAASAAGLGTMLLPSPAFASPRWDRTLLLIKLDGGNDGLNTLIPYTEQLYYRYRPSIALSGASIRQLDARFALNSALAPLLPSWKSGAGDMAILLGVGYPDQNDSHFKSTDIWSTAVPSDNTPDEGWIARLFDLMPPPRTAPADGALIGNIPADPLAGPTPRVIVTAPGESLTASPLGNISAEAARNPVYAWMAAVQETINGAAAPFNALDGISLGSTFPNSEIGAKLAHAARLIVGRIGVPVISMIHEGFDTHSNQIADQNALLSDLAAALAAFRQEMLAQGLWNNVLVATWAEFGRSAFENSARGTDHGQANTHFLFGGRVRGGYVGDQYPLDSISPDADIRAPAYQVDFRQILATFMQSWWGIPAATSNSVLQGSFPGLPVLAV